MTVERERKAAATASLWIAGLWLALPAWAHEQAGQAAGFVTGMLHPVSGLDHVLAMVAVGLWGAQLGAPAIWLLPVTFPLVMAFGGFLGLLGVPVPGVEIGIAISAILLGAMVATQSRPPLWLAAAIVGFFAIFHGHAHGTELPQAAEVLIRLLDVFGSLFILILTLPVVAAFMPAGPPPTTRTFFLRPGGVISRSASRPARGFTRHVTGLRLKMLSKQPWLQETQRTISS